MTLLSFVYNVNLIAIQNTVIGSYFAIYNNEIAMKLYFVLQERGITCNSNNWSQTLWKLMEGYLLLEVAGRRFRV